MTTFTATAKDGSIHTRNSKTKQYTHAVVVWDEKNQDWGVLSWASSRELAEKSMTSRWKEVYPKFEIVEVAAH